MPRPAAPSSFVTHTGSYPGSGPMSPAPPTYPPRSSSLQFLLYNLMQYPFTRWVWSCPCPCTGTLCGCRKPHMTASQPHVAPPPQPLRLQAPVRSPHHPLPSNRFLFGPEWDPSVSSSSAQWQAPEEQGFHSIGYLMCYQNRSHTE